MGVEMVPLISYILMRGSRPQLDFQRPPYSPAGTDKRHERCWALGAPLDQRVALLRLPYGTRRHQRSQFLVQWSGSLTTSDVQNKNLLKRPRQKSIPMRRGLWWHPCTKASALLPCVWAPRGDQSYLKILPPDIDGRKGQLHLLPAGVFMALIGDFDEDEEDPCCYASSHQHEDPCWEGTDKQRESRGGDAWATNPDKPRRFHWAGMQEWCACLAQWSPLLFQPAPTDDGGCEPHTINRKPQLHKATAQVTVRHTSTEHPRRH